MQIRRGRRELLLHGFHRGFVGENFRLRLAQRRLEAFNLQLVLSNRQLQRGHPDRLLLDRRLKRRLVVSSRLGERGSEAFTLVQRIFAFLDGYL